MDDDQALNLARHAEFLLDQEIDRLNNLHTEDYEVIREKRLQLMKLQHKQQQSWLENGHGSYVELGDQNAFFDCIKASRNVICHFYRDSTWRCQIVDKHLDALAQQHMEAKFVKINAEKAPFLVERMGVWTLPTMLLIQDGKTVEKMEGFAALGSKDDFTTKTLERYIQKKGLFSKLEV